MATESILNLRLGLRVLIKMIDHRKGIYCITNLINDKKYIGSTFKSFKRRIASHKCLLRCNCHPNRHLQNAWRLYGECNFSFSVLEVIENEVELLKREAHWIHFYNCCDVDFGYNLGQIDVNSGRRIITEETKKKIGEKQLGKLNHRYGKRLTDEERLVKSLNTRGTRCGEDNPMFGKKLSPDKKEVFVKMGKEASSKTWKITFDDGQSIIVKNLRKYCEESNISYAAMIGYSKRINSRNRSLNVKQVQKINK